MAFLKKKIEAGAEFIVTQMFYNNSRYFEFVDKCREAGINVPIIPGLKPLTTKKQLYVLPNLFHMDLPEELTEAVEACKDDKQVAQIGIEWAVQQSKELKAKDAPVLHFYTMGRSAATYAIAKEVF